MLLLLVACLVALRDRSPGGASTAARSATTATTASGAPSARPPTPRSSSTTVSPPDRADAAAAALRSLVDAPASCATRGRGAGVTLTCPIEGGVVEYRRPATPGDEYRRAVGPRDPAVASGPAACASGGEEERAWSRPDAPTVTAGRYACRVVEGRAELWWTEDATALLARASRSDGDLAALFEWWRAGAPVANDR